MITRKMRFEKEDDTDLVQIIMINDADAEEKECN